jgi:hypothetical protein
VISALLRINRWESTGREGDPVYQRLRLDAACALPFEAEADEVASTTEAEGSTHMSREALRSVIRSYRTVAPKNGNSDGTSYGWNRKATMVVRTVVYCAIGAFLVLACTQASMSERKHSAPHSAIIR